MKLNQEFIRQLRNGEITAENNGTLEQLIEVLKSAFPEDSVIPSGNTIYYSRSTSNSDKWMASPLPHKDKPTLKISDFYQPELFTGWAKDDSVPRCMMYFNDDLPKYGFDCVGLWQGEENCEDNYSEDKTNRPATHEEIEKHLTEEAKRRGYKGGGTIKGIHGTTHWRPEIASFYYDAESDSLVTDMECVVYEKGQWAEIIEKPKPQPKKSNTIHYLIDGVEYSFNYQELKFRYEDICQYSDKQFMEELPEIAHLACIVSYLKGLGTQATIGDKGIIHEIIHLMTNPEEPTNNITEIRLKFNKLIQLV